MAAREQPPRLPRRTTANEPAKSRFCPRATSSPAAANATRMRCPERRSSTWAEPCSRATAVFTATPSRGPTAQRLRPPIILHRWRTLPTRRRANGYSAGSKIRRPTRHRPRCPTYKLSDADASDISAYLVSSSTPHAGDTARASAKPAADADPSAGPSLYGESFCASCHAVQNAAGNLVGGDLGPELTRIGNKAKPEWLAAWLQNPRVYDATTPMPHYRFTPQQIATLVDLSAGKVGFRLRLGRSSGCSHRAADRPRAQAHRRTGMRGMPRDQWRAEAGELRARPQHHRKQAAGADRVPARHGALAAQLHCRPRSASRGPSAPA